MPDGRRSLSGRLAGFADSVVTLETEDGERLSIAKKDASWVRLVEDDYLEDLEE